MTKTCKRCDETKPALLFQGRSLVCRACLAADKRAAAAVRREAGVLPASQVCLRCDHDLPASAFMRDAGTSTGLRRSCRGCEREMRRRLKESARRKAGALPKAERLVAWREAAAERRAARTAPREAARRTPEEIRARQVAYEYGRRGTPEGQARRAVQSAVAAGAIEKPAACQDCGTPTNRRALHGHHDDYGRPLDVRWLCIRCHKAAHGGRWGRSLPKAG